VLAMSRDLLQQRELGNGTLVRSVRE